MAAIFRRLRRDLGSNRLQRVSVFLILLSATAALTTSLTARARSDSAWEDLFRESNGAHAWVYGAEDALRPILERPEVSDSTGPLPMARFELPRDPQERGGGPGVWLQGIEGDPPPMGGPIVVAGRWLEGPGEVVLPRTLGNLLGYPPGSTLMLDGGNGPVELTVVGHALFAGHSPFISPEVAWTRPSTISASAPERRFAGLGIQLEHPAGARAFLEEFTPDGAAGTFFQALTSTDVEARNDEASAVIVLFLGIFSVFALGACALVIVNAMSSRIVARYRDIGLLKAVGFTPGQLTAGFLIEQCGLALLAVVPGVLLGNALVPLLDDSNAALYQTRSSSHVDPLLSAGIALGVVALVAVATAVPAWRAGRVSAVRAIQAGSGGVSARPSRLAAFAVAVKAPAWATLGLKNAFDRPVRSWFTVAALTVSIITLGFLVTTEWTIRELIARPELLGEPYEIEAELEDRAALEAAIRADPEVEAYFERETMNVAVPGKEHDVTLAVLGPGFEQVDWVISKGRTFAAPGEAIAGQGFLDLMGLDVGDTVELQVRGRTVSLAIVGRFRSTDDGGRWVMTSTGTARQQLDPGYQAGGFAIDLREGADPQAAEERYRQAGGGGRTEVYEQSTDGVTAIRGVTTGLAVLLLVVGLTSLISTMSNNVRERGRELGILRAVGLSPAQVVGEVLVGAGWLTAIALAIGMPLSLWVNSVISVELGESLGWGGGIFETPPLAWVAAIVPVVFAAALLAALVPGFSAARLRVSEALRSE